MPTYELSHNGITLTFSAATTRRTGTHHDGSPWIEGPVDWVGQSPAATTTGDRLHGAQIDPDPSDVYPTPLNGFDSRVPTFPYSDALNAGYQLATGGPITITPASGSYKSLVAVRSHPAVAFNQAVSNSAVVTIYHSDFLPASGNVLRPWYAGPVKQDELFEFSDIDQSLLPSVNVGLSSADVASITDDVDAFWGPSHGMWTNLAIHPSNQMPSYYSAYADAIGAAMCLCLTTQRNDAALRGVIAWGIDAIGMIVNGAVFRGGAGHSSGKHGPMLFAAHLLGRTDWRDMVAASHPAEHEQCWYVAETKRINITASPSGQFQIGETISNGLGWSAVYLGRDTSPHRIWWRDETGTLGSGQTVTGGTSGATCTTTGAVTSGVYNFGVGGYTASHVGMPEWSQGHAENLDPGSGVLDPRPSCSGDDLNWLHDPYRRLNGEYFLGHTVPMRALGLQPYWGEFAPGDAAAWFDYSVRYFQLEETNGPFEGESWTHSDATMPPDFVIALYEALWGGNSAAGAISLAGSAAGSVRIGGQASGTIGITGSAAGIGEEAIQGTAAGSIAVAGSSAGAVAIAGSAAGAIGLAGAAKSESAIAGSAAGAIGLSGAGIGVIGDHTYGTAAGTVAIGGTATGAARVVLPPAVSWPRPRRPRQYPGVVDRRQAPGRAARRPSSRGPRRWPGG